MRIVNDIQEGAKNLVDEPQETADELQDKNQDKSKDKIADLSVKVF